MNPTLVGQRIRTARENLGIDYATLAQRTSLDRTHLQQIEAGDATLNITHVGEVAKALRVHPFTLLGADAATLTQNQPHATDALSESMISPLAVRLKMARTRAKLLAAQATHALGITETALADIESGASIPDDALLAKIVGLYPVDGKKLRDLAGLARDYPDTATRLMHLEQLLGTVLSILNRSRQTLNGNANLAQLHAKLTECLFADGESPAAERRAGYFSIGHLSDELLQALQDPLFHQQAEELAAHWQQSTPLPPPTDDATLENRAADDVDDDDDSRTL